MFQLLIIGSVSTSTGSIWKKKPTDLYLIEITEPVVKTDEETVSFVCQQLLYLIEGTCKLAGFKLLFLIDFNKSND